MLLSVSEKCLSEIETLTCWIYQEEFSNDECIVQHYDETNSTQKSFT